MVPKIINSPNTRSIIAKQNRNGGSLPRTVALLYSDVKKEFFSTNQDYLTEADSKEEAESFIPYLKKLGIKPIPIPADTKLSQRLTKARPKMAINLVGTFKGYESLASAVPGMLEMLEIPYTGADMLGFSLGCNKYLIKEIMQQHGIPVPKFQLMSSSTSQVDPSLHYPLITKLNEIHGSVEITNESIVENESQLRKRVGFLTRTYDQDVLVEEFIDGRELASFVFQAINKKVYSVERHFNIDSQNKYKFLDFDTNWNPTDTKDYLSKVQTTKYHEPLLEALVKKAFEVTKMGDYGKFDIRMDRLGNYYFVDANCNCYFTPPEYLSELTMTMKMYGIPFLVMLKRLLQNTMREWGY